MHDSGRLVGGDSDEFEEVAEEVGADYEQSFLAVVLVLDIPEGVLPGVVIAASLMPCFRADGRIAACVNPTFTPAGSSR